jgi:GTP-binding protein
MAMKSLAPRVRSARFLAAAAAPAELPPPVAVEIAFAGRSNVGKSSLLNGLLERKGLVRTSSTPGCTRQITFFEALLPGDTSLTLVDLPGYGYARRSKREREAWADLIEHYLLGRPTLRAVVVIVDVRRGLEDDDRDLLKMIEQPQRKQRPEIVAIVVATKLDKLSPHARKPALEKVRAAAGRTVIGFSAVEGTGRAELWQWIIEAAGVSARP